MPFALLNHMQKDQLPLPVIVWRNFMEWFQQRLGRS